MLSQDTLHMTIVKCPKFDLIWVLQLIGASGVSSLSQLDLSCTSPFFNLRGFFGGNPQIIKTRFLQEVGKMDDGW